MIDVENQILTRINQILKPLNVQVVNVVEYAKSVFPTVSVVETDNKVSRFDNASYQKFNKLTYDINIYTTTIKEQKKISSIIDDELYNLNFKRLTKLRVPMKDSSINRLVLRYTVEVDNNHNLYRG